MSVPTKGTINASTPLMNGSSTTISNVQVNSGNDRLLVLLLTTSNQQTHSSVTYGTESMTELTQITRGGGLSAQMSFWYIKNPIASSANAVITFSGGLYISISVYFQAFTNSGGVGQYSNVGGGTSPRDGTLTVQQDSLIMTTGACGAPIDTMQIPTGNNRPFISHTVTKNVGNAISENVGHNAGTIDVRNSASNNISIDSYEIKGLAGSGSSRRRIIIC
tara:strand:+ start:353 stop:1012 length:660 start_codon:yes stop_codon:yes gene_type:complete